MTRLFAITSLVAIMLVPAVAHAQVAVAGAESLTLEQVVRDALTNNARLRAARLGAEAAQSGVASARGSFFPRVSFTEGWQRGDQPVYVFSTLLASRWFAATNFAIDQLNHPDPVNAFHAGAAIEQVLFDGGGRSATLARARADADAANAVTDAAAGELVMTVTELYGQVLGLQTARSAIEGALGAAREDLARAGRRRDAGMVTEADVLSLAVHVADLEQRAIRADADLAIARAQVNRLADAPVERAFSAVEPVVTSDTPGSFADLIAEAQAHRPELQRAAAAARAAEQGQRAARAAFLPQVAAQAALDVSGTRAFTRATSWLVGGEVRWSLGVAGTERAHARAAASLAAQARVEASDAEAQTRVDVLTALEQLRSARARQAVGRAIVAQAAESHRITRDRYEAGIAPINDLLRTSTAVLDAEAQRVAALIDELTSRARLDRAVGRVP